MMSAPTILTSSSGLLSTVPGCQLGIDGSAFRLCSGAAYFSAYVGAHQIAAMAATVAAARDLFMAPPWRRFVFMAD